MAKPDNYPKNRYRNYEDNPAGRPGIEFTEKQKKEIKELAWKFKIQRILTIAIILCSLLSALFLTMYFVNHYHSMYLFNMIVSNQGLLALLILRRGR